MKAHFSRVRSHQLDGGNHCTGLIGYYEDSINVSEALRIALGTKHQTEWGKNRFTVACMENNMIINQ